LKPRIGLGIDRINRHSFASPGARAYFRNLHGWLDDGERALIEAAWRSVAAPRVLDIGVGAGRTVPLLAPRAVSYVGIDSLPPMIDMARERFDADVRLMDARALAFPDAAFDVVAFSYNGLDAVGFEDRHVVLGEVARVLAPGGVFAFSSLNRDGPDYREPYRPTFPRAGRRLAVELARSLAKSGVGLFNYIRHGRHVVETDEMAIAVSSAHNYGVPAVFISVPRQAVQLRAHGMALECAFSNTDGAELDIDRPALKPIWTHYLARRMPCLHPEIMAAPALERDCC